ncbi:MAG: aspartate carbamoyltransferase catalytic subunit, partial [Actinomycetota bacterium]|nr:aspartate carbamoyltransferase catalytic subunit [Actinomycetota bacterium]
KLYQNNPNPNIFQNAAKRLSADAVNMTASASATVKGESLRDTAQTLSAMACDLIVVRHKYAGAPEVLAECMDTHVINGGDGMHEHPTQALLDLFTMKQSLGHLEGLTVGIVGDICHSRVAGSLVPALRKVGARPIIIAPPTLLPARPDVLGAEVSTSLDDVLPELDVAYMLRIQMERAEGMPFPSVREYARLFGMNSARLAAMKPSALVMHPGPMNRGVEISSAVADSDRAIVLDQVNAGVAVRMAAMYLLLGGESGGAAA